MIMIYELKAAERALPSDMAGSGGQLWFEKSWSESGVDGGKLVLMTANKWEQCKAQGPRLLVEERRSHRGPERKQRPRGLARKLGALPTEPISASSSPPPLLISLGFLYCRVVFLQ
ncbi:hypothetical protein Y032_0010g906 [Ancylostoma ceylanicum]|nr:hypothetical protein Y032_0010g906 [Ancylostoma ceylanicum]